MPGSYLQTLASGLEVLVALQDGPMTVAELCQRLGSNRAAVYRLVRTLEHHRFVQRDELRGTYGLGIVLWELGVAALPIGDLRGAAEDQVRELAREFGETVHLAIYDAGDVVYIDKADGTHPLRSYTRLGGRAPAYCVSTGKILLAMQAEGERERVLSQGLEQHTPKTVTDPEELRRQLKRIAATGVSVNRGEWNSEVAGVAVPIRAHDGATVAALGFSGPVTRLLQHLGELTEGLKQAASTISQRLGRTSIA